MCQDQLSTRERIIDIAGDLFGQKGFKETTIRAIAEAAEVNVAAINYHFRDKEGLYAEVLEDIFSKGFARFPSKVRASDPPVPAEERLKIFIKGTIYRFLSPEGWGGQMGKGRLVIREIQENSQAFSAVIGKYLRPHKDELIVILTEILGVKVPIESILCCGVSIIGQCIYYVYATSMIETMAPEFIPLENHIDHIVDHVFRFSLGGLNKIKMDLDKEKA